MTRHRSFLSARKTFLPAVLLGLATLQSHAGLAPDLPPGGNFALDNWRLDMPVTNPITGELLSIAPMYLSGTNGFSLAPWFHTDTDGAMTLWTPVNGVTAGGSRHPRNEFRELIDPSSHEVNWNSFGNSILEAKLRVMQVPRDGILIVGQVHGFDAAPLVLVYYRYDAVKQTGRVFTKLQGTPVLGPPYSQHVIANNVKLGQAFSYLIKVERQPGGPAVVSVSANNGNPATMVMDASWDGVGMYFKAGSYLHTYGSSSTEGGLAKFYLLATSHPANGLSITSGEALPYAGVNIPYSLQLQSQGGVGGGTWSLVSGFPPKGLTLHPNGVINGAPLPGTASPIPNEFMVRVRDANGSTYSKKLSILVNP
jgi:hypothetical protein